jgi:hypothetical protein
MYRLPEPALLGLLAVLPNRSHMMELRFDIPCGTYDSFSFEMSTPAGTNMTLSNNVSFIDGVSCMGFSAVERRLQSDAAPIHVDVSPSFLDGEGPSLQAYLCPGASKINVTANSSIYVQFYVSFPYVDLLAFNVSYEVRCA